MIQLNPWQQLPARVLCFLLGLASAGAEVKLAPLFQDHLVLQTGMPVPIWGTAAPGEKVSVSFAKQNLSAVAANDGKWRVVFAPLPVDATPAAMKVAGTNELTVEDILVGEVWLCSGQSNMEFELGRAKDAEHELATADFPLIRHFRVKYAFSNAPETSARGAWIAIKPGTTGSYTAVGYFFARSLHEKLGVPIGFIQTTWGGTDIEAWISHSSLAANPALKFVAEHWQERLDRYPAAKASYDEKEAAAAAKAEEAKAQGVPFKKPWNPAPPNPDGSPYFNKTSALYNGMISPLLPAAIRGVLWYQGENNAGRAGEYMLLQPTLIADWRRAFGQPQLPFFWVQLPNFHGNSAGTDWVEMREAQAKSLVLPATGQAITIDVGEVNDIHPTTKRPVGERLARLALHRVYGQKILDTGPRFAGAKFSGNTVRVEFNDTAAGLKRGGDALQGFEVAGSDKKFFAATARIEGAAVVVNAPEVSAPAAVRYAWHNAPTANLFNSELLPAEPFRSDAW